jgi:hypothetical protein
MICHALRPDPKLNIHILYATDCDNNPIQFVGKTSKDAEDLFNRARDYERKFLTNEEAT